jgi:flavin reductase ActVB
MSNIAEQDRFREAMARFPSGVTIVTTADDQRQPHGFTATAFCSLSVDPPLVLVCLAKGAECHPVFERAPAFAVNVIHPGQADLAVLFATRGADKFAAAQFDPGVGGVPTLPDACAVLECSTFARHDGGDHTILIGAVERVGIGDRSPAVYADRDFHELPPRR